MPRPGGGGPESNQGFGRPGRRSLPGNPQRPTGGRYGSLRSRSGDPSARRPRRGVASGVLERRGQCREIYRVRPGRRVAPPGEVRAVFEDEETFFKELLEAIDQAMAETRAALDEAEGTAERLYEWLE